MGDEMDANNDGGIELQEFAEMQPFGMDEGEITADTKQRFAMVDSNGDGKLSWEEMKTKTKSDVDSDHDATHHLINLADNNGDGNIDAKEFIASMSDFQDQNPEASQILTAILQKHKAVALSPAILLDVSSLVPLGAGLVLLAAYSLRRRCVSTVPTATVAS